MSLRFWPDRMFNCEFRKSKQSSYSEESDVLCVQRFKQTPGPTAIVVVSGRGETRQVRCTAQDPSVRANADCLWSVGGECANVNLSWYFVLVFHDVTDYFCS